MVREITWHGLPHANCLLVVSVFTVVVISELKGYLVILTLTSFKGAFSDSNDIFLWYQEVDLHIRVIQMLAYIPSLRYSELCTIYV